MIMLPYIMSRLSVPSIWPPTPDKHLPIHIDRDTALRIFRRSVVPVELNRSRGLQQQFGKVTAERRQILTCFSLSVVATSVRSVLSNGASPVT